MASLVNLQVYGVPIVTYGLIGVTTAILAYATAIGGVGDAVSESLSSSSTAESPMSALSNMNPLSPAPAPAPALTDSLLSPESSAENPSTGGKKRNKKVKTPKSKKSKRNGKTKKSHRK